jgi:putative phosphoesterase
VRVALLSDVHGNAVALRTVARALERERPEAVVCLGDMVLGGPQPAEVVDLLDELGWPVVLGNTDAFLLDPGAGWEAPGAQQLESRAWSVERLGPERLDRIAAYRLTVELDLEEGSLLAFHGSPSSYNDFLLPQTPEGVFRELLGGLRADVLAGGHVHLQFLRRVGPSLFVNPGSVGFGYDHAQSSDDFRLDPWAAYAVVEASETGAMAVSLRRAPFDPGDVVEAIEASTMPNADAVEAMWSPRP